VAAYDSAWSGRDAIRHDEDGGRAGSYSHNDHRAQHRVLQQKYRYEERRRQSALEYVVWRSRSKFRVQQSRELAIARDE
jgi:hypothetical protein